MSLPPLIGHREARQRLARAAAGGRLPQVLAVTGPPGVGKQRLSLWLGQLVLCEHPGEEPCGACRPCRLVSALGHADLHWYVPIARPKAGDPDKQVDEAAEAVEQVLQERRANPLYTPADGMAIHPIATVRLLQRQAGLTSVEGGWRVFLIGEADRLVPQDSTEAAANALLKLLEEPPPRSLFLLTTVDVRRLLPTIRSRAVPVRLNRLADAEVAEFLRAQMKPPLSSTALAQRVAVASGSIGDALAVGEDTGKAYQAASDLLDAVAAGPKVRLERALKQAPWSARGDFSAMLDALAETLSDAARGSLGQPTRRPVPEPLRRYRSPEPLLRAMERVAEAREAAWGNVNPQLLLAVLGEELAEVL